MFVRKRRRPVSEINVVPYIDVMLVLLVIFMVTAPLISQGVKVDLPKADAKAIEQEDDQTIIVSIDAQGRYFINIVDDNASSQTADQISAIVQTALEKSPQTPVVVNGDAKIAYEQIIEMMVLLQQAGASSVGLMTDPKDI